MDQEIGRRLRGIREAHTLSQRQLALLETHFLQPLLVAEPAQRAQRLEPAFEIAVSFEQTADEATGLTRSILERFEKHPD